MIENAYFYVNPPDTGPETTKKERPPMHQYIRKLLYNDLCKSNTEKILRQVSPANSVSKFISFLYLCIQYTVSQYPTDSELQEPHKRGPGVA